MTEQKPKLQLFEPITQPKRNFEAVADHIRREILSGRLAVGQKLPNELDLARQFKVGRSAVREALKTLELAGLLSVRRGYHGGTFVAAPVADPRAEAAALPGTLGEVGGRSLHQARLALELPCAELAAMGAGPEGAAALARALELEEAQLALPARFIAAYLELHGLLAELSGNPILAALVSSLGGLTAQEINRLADRRELREAIVGQHRALIAAVAAGDGPAAGAVVADHLRFVFERALPVDEAAP